MNKTQYKKLEARLRQALPVGTLIKINEKRFSRDRNGNTRYSISFYVDREGGMDGDIIEAIGRFTGQRVHAKHVIPFVTSQMHGSELLEIIGARLYNDLGALKWYTFDKDGNKIVSLTSRGAEVELWREKKRTEADLDQVKAVLGSMSTPLSLDRSEHYQSVARFVEPDHKANGVDPDGNVWENGKVVSLPLPVAFEQAQPAKARMYAGPAEMEKMGLLELEENRENFEYAAQRRDRGGNEYKRIIDQHEYKHLLMVYFACKRVLECEDALALAQAHRAALLGQ